MKHRLLPEHKEHIGNLGMPSQRKIKVSDDDYVAHYAEWRKTLPDAGHDVWHMKALGHAAWQQHNAKQPRHWGWGIVAGILICLVLFALPAHCQFSKVNSIQFQQNGTPVTGAFFTFPFSINCGFNMTCTASGSVLTIAGPASGTGTVTSFSAGTLPPLFTTAVANPTTTPALSFSLSNAGANTVFGNNTSGSAAPGFQSLVAAQEPATTVNSVVNDTNVTGTIAAQAITLGWTGTLAKARNLATAVYTDQNNAYSAGTTQAMDTLKAAFWSDANIIDVARACPGTDMCDKFNACYALSAYTNNTRNILDGRGLATPGATLHCDNQDPFGNATRSTKWILPAAKISMLKYMLILGTTNESIAAPSAPSLATSTSGGSLAAAIGVGVKVAYCNNTGTSLPSSEATITTGAGATNSVTVPSPAFVFGATTYRAYSATPVGSGWKENNASGCIPLGTNYVIKTIGAGAVPLATATAYGGMFELEGQGDSTEISLDQTTPGSTNELYTGSNTNTYIHNLKMTTGTSAANNGGTIQVQNGTAGSKVVIENVTIQGGGHGIYIGPAAVANVTTRNIRCSGFTVSASCIFTLAGTNIRMDNTEVLNTVWPAGGNLQGVVNLDGCTDCSINGVVGRNLDFSNITNAAVVIIQNSSLRTNIQNVNCQGNVNADCVAVLTSSLDTNISNVENANTTVGTGAGIGPNANNGDTLDFFGAGRITVSNVTAQSLGLVGGLRFPCFEFFDDDEINATNINCYDSSGEGIRIFGSPRTLITNSHFNRNGKSGVSVEDSASIVTCNNTTTVTLVSGNPFGPWNSGTKAFIGPTPTQFTISSVTNGSTLILTTTCNLGASQALSVYSTDVQLIGIQADANGTGLVGANAQSGISATGHSVVAIIGGSMNDDKPSQTQQWGVSTAGGFSRVMVDNADFSGNLGTTCNGIEYGAAVSGNHGMCDANSASPAWFNDGSTKTWQVGAQQSIYLNNKLGQADIVADSSAINTTETVIVKTPALPANRFIAGTHARAILTGTCTSTVANASTFTVRWGTNGTTADGTIAALVSSNAATSGTNNGFRAVIDLTVRIAGASATSAAFMQLTSDGNIGIVATPNDKSVAGTAFNTTTASAILSVAYKSAATTTTCTFKNATIEIVQN